MTGPQSVAGSGPLVQRHDFGRVRILTLNRPAARNALSTALRTELILQLQDAERDEGIGAVVLTGAGSAFAAGADLAEMAARTTAQQAEFIAPPNLFTICEGLRLPIVVAINGHALGAGLELATACDYRIAATTAKLGQPEITLGLIPGGGGTVRLHRLVGAGHAARLVLSGERVEAAHALAIGLVDEVVTAETLLERAVALGTAMASQDRGAVTAGKQALAAAREMPYSDALAVERELFLQRHSNPSAQARIRAFLEK